MEVFKVLTVLLAYTTLMGFTTAWYQYKMKEEWKQNYHDLRERKLDEMKKAMIIGVGREMMSKAADKFGL